MRLQDLPPELLTDLRLPDEPPVLEGLEVYRDAMRAIWVAVWHSPTGRHHPVGQFTDIAEACDPNRALAELLARLVASERLDEAEKAIVAAHVDRLVAWMRSRGQW